MLSNIKALRTPLSEVAAPNVAAICLDESRVRPSTDEVAAALAADGARRKAGAGLVKTAQAPRGALERCAIVLGLNVLAERGLAFEYLSIGHRDGRGANPVWPGLVRLWR